MKAEHTLNYLERCPRTPAWIPYVQIKQAEVRAHIIRLRAFAALKPGRVRILVNAKASQLETRLVLL